MTLGHQPNALATVPWRLVYKADKFNQYYQIIKNDLAYPCGRNLFLHEKYKLVHKKLQPKPKDMFQRRYIR